MQAIYLLHYAVVSYRVVTCDESVCCSRAVRQHTRFFLTLANADPLLGILLFETRIVGNME